MFLEGPANAPSSQNPYSQILKDTAKHHRLLSVHWELTYRCNERCTHCYLDVLAPNTSDPHELTTTECLHALDEMAKLGVLNLTLSGGEILTRHDFFEIATYARAKHFLLRLFTNGILITEPVADRIAKLHPYAVEISVYGANAETHECITQVPHSFERTTRALRWLHERGVRTFLKTPLMRENLRQLPAMETLARNLGAQFRYDVTITPKDNGSWVTLKHRLTQEDLMWLFRQTLDPADWSNRLLKSNDRSCGITLNALVIDPHGNVSPCVQVRRQVGNVREHSLQELWTDSPVWCELGNLTWEELPVCRTCDIKPLCTRCHGLAQLEDGKLAAPSSIACQQALARRQVLIEKGGLPLDYPIPGHLREIAARMNDNNPGAFIPQTSLFAMPTNA